MKYCEILRERRKKPKDEYYTLYKDIEVEISQYKEYLNNKIIYCCADSDKSNFYKYLKNNFKELNLKKLICTSFSLDSNGELIIIEKDINNDLILEKKINLKGNGDFRSEECLAFLKKCDVLITNPPFSLIRDLIDIIITYDKKFIIIGNELCITYKKFFQYYRDNKIKFGFNNSISHKFLTNEGNYKNINNTIWYQNILDIDKPYIKFEKDYNESKYLKYYNYPKGINVDKCKDIPKNYFGEMGVPVSFGKYLNREQFEIIGMGKGILAKELGAEKNTISNNGYDLFTLDDKGTVKHYLARLIIKRKK